MNITRGASMKEHVFYVLLGLMVVAILAGAVCSQLPLGCRIVHSGMIRDVQRERGGFLSPAMWRVEFVDGYTATLDGRYGSAPGVQIGSRYGLLENWAGTWQLVSVASIQCARSKLLIPTNSPIRQ